MRSKFEGMIRVVQLSITDAIARIDGQAEFQEDACTRANGANGGGGMSRRVSCLAVSCPVLLSCLFVLRRSTPWPAKPRIFACV